MAPAKKRNFVIQDENGCTVRYLNWPDGASDAPVMAVWLPRARRVEFVTDIKKFEDEKVPVEILATIKKSDVTEAGKEIRIPESRGDDLTGARRIVYLRAVNSIEDFREDARVSNEKEKPLPLFLKYITAIQLAVLGIVFVLAWVSARFFNSTPKAVTVRVFSQQDIKQFQSTPQIVNVANHRVRMAPHQLPHEYAARHVVRHGYKRTFYRHARYTTARWHGRAVKYARARYGRPGTSVSDAGVLGVLGGMGPQYHGSGGLNIHARNNNPGIGYGGPALRGGFERGMLGKGLIATGIGDGSSLQGYGGTSRRGGLGGGAPGYGYGRMRLAGSAGAYFEPIPEDSIVEGGLDRDQINAVIQQNLGQITYCYEVGLQRQPRLAGRVAVHFVIGSRGWVTFARVANTSLRSRQVEDCIVQKLRGWKFPRPAGEVSVRVTYPFVLERLSPG